MALRHELRPGDLGRLVQLHGQVYAEEQGWDCTFEAYVAGPMAEFVLRRDPRERLWIAQRGSDVVGCIAIVAGAPGGSREAQLRWFLVVPSARGAGLGRRLLETAVAFSWDRGYDSIFLWTVRALAPASRLYLGAGFRLVEEKPGRLWGAEVVEERYVLRRGAAP